MVMAMMMIVMAMMMTLMTPPLPCPETPCLLLLLSKIWQCSNVSEDDFHDDYEVDGDNDMITMSYDW